MMVRPRSLVLDDGDLAGLADMDAAIRAVERAFMARIQGGLVAPPRQQVEFPGQGRLVFTVGGTTSGDGAAAGFRAYDTFGSGDAHHTQVVAVWDPRTAELRGIILGERLGDLRTGAIGGLAVRLMARPDAETVGVIGSGAQARTQLEAAAAVRRLRTVRVFSRSPERRAAFAKEMGRSLGLTIEPAASARACVEDADIVLLATTSGIPVIEAGWIKTGAHVNTLGPKTRQKHEVGLDVAVRATMIATDSPEQARGCGDPFFLEGTPHMDRMVELAALLAAPAVAARPSADAITLFCSVGLAGTEVFVADELLRRARPDNAVPSASDI